MPPKRKLPALGLERRVKARKEEDWDPDMDQSEDGSDSDQVSEEGVGRGDPEDDNETGPDDENDSDDGSDSGPEAGASSRPKVDLSSISFGALAKAQESLPQGSRKRKSKIAEADEKETTSRKETYASRTATTKKPSKPPGRTSKNAPQEQSSKHPVSRRREILTDPRRAARDPRFDTLGSSNDKIEELKAEKAYSFLDDYRESEMAELRKRIKKTTDEAQKAVLKRELHSMESRKKTKDRKAEAERVIQEHRKQEKELVAQGKTPFYLKKSEQKKRALTDRFKGMSKGQVDRAIERKRKKTAGREKKELGSMERIRRRD
ncbi:DUF947-domain-containing protein [Sarocladium strictum]